MIATEKNIEKLNAFVLENDVPVDMAGKQAEQGVTPLLPATEVRNEAQVENVEALHEANKMAPMGIPLDDPEGDKK
jgi:hypothetical protein